MGKKILLLLMIINICLFSCISNKNKTDNKNINDIDKNDEKNNYIQKGGKALYGQLKVIGTQLCDESGKPVQLRGIGSHGIQWYGQFMNSKSIAWLKNDWGITLTRAAVIVEPGYSGYVENASSYSKITKVIDAAIESEIYILVDWHVLKAGDPNKYKNHAKSFFKKIAQTYGNAQNIIYEICNEPNGDYVKWDNKIKPYAEELIALIRGIDPDGIIVVGTGTWSQDIHDAAKNPLKHDNIMYTCHFYAYSHKEWLRDRIDKCLNGTYGNAIPIFVTEWGTTDYTGNTNYTEKETRIWIDFLNKRKISWCNWSLANKSEGSAALKSGAGINGGWTDDYLTESGMLVRSLIKGK